MSAFSDWLDSAGRGEFYVQAGSKQPWHVERDDNCEIMLCGLFISVDSLASNVQSSWGPRKCPDCWLKLEQLKKIKAMR